MLKYYRQRNVQFKIVQHTSVQHNCTSVQISLFSLCVTKTYCGYIQYTVVWVNSKIIIYRVAQKFGTIFFLYALTFPNINTDISQGSVATHLRRSGIFSNSIITNFLLILTVNKHHSDIHRSRYTESRYSEWHLAMLNRIRRISFWWSNRQRLSGAV